VSEHIDADDKIEVAMNAPRSAYPPNSDGYKQKQAEEQASSEPEKTDVKPRYTITKREKTFGEKLKEAVFGENVKNVPEHVFFNIIVPNVMRMFGDSINGALNMTFRGFGRGSSADARYRDDGSPYRDYDRMYERDRNRSWRRATPTNIADFDDYIFNSDYGVKHAIDELNDLLDRYKEITVADVCQQIGKSPKSIDNKWGWRSTRDFEAVPVRDGWILSVPDPRYLD